MVIPSNTVTDIILQFSGDTPNVIGSTVEIQFTSNAPLDSAMCSIRPSRLQPINCRVILSQSV